MADPSPAFSRSFAFGPFVADVRAGELRKHGARVKLQERPFQLLVALLERPGEVVTREELRQRLWPDGIFVDFDHSIGSSINKLRAALNDSARHSHYIETVGRRGYRFIAHVEGVMPARTLNFPALDGPSASSPRRPFASVVVLCSPILAALLAALVAFGLLVPPPVPRLVSFAQPPISDWAVSWAGLSTDGARVYFMEKAGDHWLLMQTSLTGGPAHQVAAPFRTTRIFGVSPDHSEFLIGGPDGPYQSLPLWVWPVQGGSPARVGNVRADDAIWAPDGQHILYVVDTDIHSVLPSGSGDRLLLRSRGRPHWLRFSPDGQRLSFSVFDPYTGDNSLWEAGADGSDPHPRFSHASGFHNACCGVWIANGKYFLFSAENGSISNLWVVSEARSIFHLRRAPPRQLTTLGTSCFVALPVGDGHRIFTFVAGDQFESIRYFPATRQAVPVVQHVQAPSFTFSPDGRWMAFSRLPDYALMRSRSDGSGLLELVPSSARTGHPSWSPDGTRIAFEARAPDRPVRAEVVNVKGGPAEEILPSQSGAQSLPVWSPDGRSVAIALNVDVTNASKLPRGIYITDWQTRLATKLPASDGLTAPQWSPDGKTIIAKTFDDHRVLRFDSRTSRWIDLVVGNDVSFPTWSGDSRYLYYQDLRVLGEPVYRLRVADGVRKKVASFESLLGQGIQRCAFYGFAPDGSMLVQITRSGSHLYAANLDLP